MPKLPFFLENMPKRSLLWIHCVRLWCITLIPTKSLLQRCCHLIFHFWRLLLGWVPWNEVPFSSINQKATLAHVKYIEGRDAPQEEAWMLLPNAISGECHRETVVWFHGMYQEWPILLERSLFTKIIGRNCNFPANFSSGKAFAHDFCLVTVIMILCYAVVLQQTSSDRPKFCAAPLSVHLISLAFAHQHSLSDMN